MPIPQWLRSLEEGRTPDDDEVLAQLTVGREGWLDPFISLYLDRFIKGEDGLHGSKVKFIVSNEGSGGKTHFLRHIAKEARLSDYETVFLRAGDFKLSHINHFYAAIAGALNLERLLNGFRNRLIQRLGYGPSEIPDSMPFISWAAQRGDAPEMLKRQLREEFGHVLQNSKIDRTFSTALINITFNDLEYGTSWREPERRQTILDWSLARTDIPLARMKREHLFMKITRQNARRMLCSLAEFVRLAGFSGLVICVDELDDLLAPKLEGRGFKYTKMGREDAYESLRELIDDQEGLQGILFLFASRRELIDDEFRGFKSYQALWMRVQEEVTAARAFNPYVDLIDLDRLWQLNEKDALVSCLSDNLLALARRDAPSLPLHGPDGETLHSVLEITPFNMRQAVRILALHLRRQFP